MTTASGAAPATAGSAGGKVRPVPVVPVNRDMSLWNQRLALRALTA